MSWGEIYSASIPLLVALVSIVVNALTNRKGTKKQIEALEAKLDGHIKEDEADKARQARARILRFADECSSGTKHSEGHFDDILEDIDRYEAYCTSHPEFPNNKGHAAMETIKHIYERCKRNNAFLK